MDQQPENAASSNGNNVFTENIIDFSLLIHNDSEIHPPVNRFQISRQPERAYSTERARNYLVEYYSRSNRNRGRFARVVTTNQSVPNITNSNLLVSGRMSRGTPGLVDVSIHDVTLPSTIGLTKQEIKRHTVSYKYIPKKRKRRDAESSSDNDNSDDSSPNKIHPASASDSCSICLDRFSMDTTVRRLPCLHIFHSKCVDKWLQQNTKCPICRIRVTINYDTLISSLGSGNSIEHSLSQQEERRSRAAFSDDNWGNIMDALRIMMNRTRGSFAITINGSERSNSNNSSNDNNNVN